VGREVSPDIFLSPAVAILCGLEQDGFDVRLTEDDALSIAPRERLTPTLMADIAMHKETIKALLRCLDNGVLARRDAMARRFTSTGGSTAALVARDDLPYRAGVCFSCGDGLPELRHGRCWRCALAWRLVMRLPIPADFAAQYDAAKVLA
jgi:hypothetical protein